MIIGIEIGPMTLERKEERMIPRQENYDFTLMLLYGKLWETYKKQNITGMEIGPITNVETRMKTDPIKHTGL